MYVENFKQYWPQQSIHFAIGVYAGYLLVKGEPAAGASIMVTVIARQGYEYAKRKDTVGIDMAYYVGGLVTGVSVGKVAPYVPVAKAMLKTLFTGKRST